VQGIRRKSIWIFFIIKIIKNNKKALRGTWTLGPQMTYF
jgi:hypothetical protein